MFCLSGLTHFDSKTTVTGLLKFGTGNVLKFTYEHIGFQKFSPDPVKKGRGRELGKKGSGIGREGEGQEGRRDRRGGEGRGGEAPLS
jgi:hypothetical protein